MGSFSATCLVGILMGCCFLIVDACTACLHIDITMFCMLLPVVYLFWRRCLQSWQKPAESFHTTIRHKQVPRVSILHMAWKVHYGLSFETSLAWCPHLPCPMLNFGQLWQASGIPITNWMMFIQEQLMLGRGIPVPTDIRWVTFGPLEAAGSSSICHTEMWSKTLRNMVSKCLESFRKYSVYHIIIYIIQDYI